MNDDIGQILEEIRLELQEDDNLKLAKDFALDAPERIQLITQVMLIREQRETNLLLEGLISCVMPIGEPPKEWSQRLEQKLDKIDHRG